MRMDIYTVVAIIYLSVSSVAIAGLEPFYEDSNEEWLCGYKNGLGEVIVPTKRYEYCGDFSDGLAYVGKKGKYYLDDGNTSDKYLQGFINQEGRLVIPVEHEVIDGLLEIDFKSFSEGLVAVYRDGKYGYMNKERELVIPYQYEDAKEFIDGLAVVSKNDKYGAINKLGHTVVPLEFNYLSSYSDGLALYTENNHWNNGFQYGFVDTKGDISLKAKWDRACLFSEGLAAVKINDHENGKWGIINKFGDYIVRPEYDVPMIQTWSEVSYDDCNYKNGRIDMYKYTDPSRPHESSIMRYTIDNKGNTINKKFFKNWSDVIEEFIESNE